MMRTIGSILVAAALLFSAARTVEATAQGAIKLDNYTFDKFKAIPGMTLLAKIDKSYAYGEKEDAFKEFCKLSYTVPNFLVGEIPVQEYGDKENSDLQERFGVKTDDMPVFYLFKGAEDPGTKFGGFPDPSAKKPVTWDDAEDGEWEPPVIKDITADNLVLWLRTNGVKMPSIGTIAELDEIAKQFMQEPKQAALDQAKKLAEGDHKNDKKAPIYVKIMQKVLEKGTGYIQTEVERVKKIMAGKVTSQKKEELQDKSKILNVFAE